MKRFYHLKVSTDPKVIGVNNGIRQAKIQRSGFKDVAKYDQLIEMLGTPKFDEVKHLLGTMDFELQYAKLLSKAKLTDFLRYGPVLLDCMPLISEKVAAVFRGHHIPQLRLFPATVESRIGRHSYLLPFLPWQSYDIIDFSQSVYYTGLRFRKEYHTFASAEELGNFASRDPTVWGEKIHLNDKFDATLDLFDLGRVGTVISERLKEALEAIHPTAMEIFPAFGEHSGTKVELD